jgi:hypothetical protein
MRLAMSEPDNHALRLLRDIRGAVQSHDQKVDRNHEELKNRIDNLARVMAGESVLCCRGSRGTTLGNREARIDIGAATIGRTP